MLTQTYSPEKYPFYDNYPDVINCNRTKDIPKDYYGVVGVPMSFLDKWNTEQFRIVGKKEDTMLQGVKKYRRLLIKRRGQ